MLGSRPVMNWTAHATGHWLGFCGVPTRARRSSDNRRGTQPPGDTLTANLLPWIWFYSIDRQIGVRALQQLEEGPPELRRLELPRKKIPPLFQSKEFSGQYQVNPDSDST